MNTQSLRERLHRQPFEPVVLRMSNGEAHVVRHPECIALGKNRLVVSITPHGRSVHLSLTLVNAIEAVQAAKRDSQWRDKHYGPRRHP